MQDKGAIEILTPPALAKELGVSPDKVLGWIRSGELEAVNLATKTGGRPRYGVTRAAVHAFLNRRTTTPHPMTTGRRKRATMTGVTEFFK